MQVDKSSCRNVNGLITDLQVGHDFGHFYFKAEVDIEYLLSLSTAWIFPSCIENSISISVLISDV